MVIKLAYFGAIRYLKKLKNLSVALTLVYIIVFFFLSLFYSLNSNLYKYWVGKYLGGDLIISSKEDYFDITSPVKFDNYLSYDDFIENNPEYENSTSPRIRAGMLLESDNEGDSISRPVIITGIDYEKERNLNDFIKVKIGRMLKPNNKEILLSRSVASYLGVDIGDTIYIFSSTVDYYQNADALEVVGFYETVMAAGFAFGDSYAFINLSSAQDLLQTENISEIVTYKRGLSRLSSDYQKKEGIKAVSLSRTIKMVYDLMFWIVITLLFIFSLCIVFQNVTMMNEERKTEVAVYLTYGVKPIWLKILMSFEIKIYVFVCCIFGALISYVLNIWLNSLGLFPVDIFSEILLGGDVLVLNRSPLMFIITWILLTLLVVIAAFFPINRSVNELNIVKLFKK